MAGGQIVSAITEAVFDVSPHIFGAMYFYIYPLALTGEQSTGPKRYLLLLFFLWGGG